MDSSRPRRTSHGAFHEAMVLGIVNVSEPFVLDFKSLHSQPLCFFKQLLNTLFFCRVRDDIEKEDAFRGLCAVVLISTLWSVFEKCKVKFDIY